MSSAGASGLRVLTWNVRNMLGDPIAVRRVLRDSRADVACLQEVSRLPGSRHRIADLARDCGLYLTCGGRASAGTAVLTGLRVDVRSAAAERLPVTGWRTRPRGWARAMVRLAGTEAVEVASLHLGLSEAERLSHLDAVLGSRLLPGAPLVLAGDLNERPGGPSWHRLLRAGLTDAGHGSGATYPAHRPRHRIDAVLVGAGVRVTAYGSPPDVDDADVRAASDHRPVLADLVLPERSVGAGAG